LVDLVTFGSLEKEPKPRTKTKSAGYRGEGGQCIRNDTQPAVEGNDYIYATGGTEDYCRIKCDQAHTCSAYEFDSKLKACKHWYGQVRGNSTHTNGTTNSTHQEHAIAQAKH